MKLETWTDGNMEIMHVISFCSYVNHSGCKGSKYISNKNKSDNGGAGMGHHCLAIVLFNFGVQVNYLSKVKIWIHMHKSPHRYFAYVDSHVYR